MKIWCQFEDLAYIDILSSFMQVRVNYSISAARISHKAFKCFLALFDAWVSGFPEMERFFQNIDLSKRNNRHYFFNFLVGHRVLIT